MTNIVVTLADDSTIVFENTIGHQVGYGAVQIMLETGEQEVFNNFKAVSVQLTDEEREDFMAHQAEMKRRAEEEIAMEEAQYKAMQEDKESEPEKGEEEPPLAN